MKLEVTNKILKGEIDVNNQDLFIRSLFRALVFKLNNQVYLRNKKIPHFVLNTGDDIMYLEVKGQDQSKEPKQQINEDFIYNSVPRCIVNLGDIEVLEDQITNPYTRGNFEFEYEDSLVGLTAEFRRLPIKLTVPLKYYLDTFTDALDVTQKIMTKMLFIQTFKFDYLGQMIQASYKVPTSYSHDKNITFDGGTTDQKLRIIELQLEIETNLPVFDNRTVIQADQYITKNSVKLALTGEEQVIETTDDKKSKDPYTELLEKKIKEYKLKDLEVASILTEILNKVKKPE